MQPGEPENPAHALRIQRPDVRREPRSRSGLEGSHRPRRRGRRHGVRLRYVPGAAPARGAMAARRHRLRPDVRIPDRARHRTCGAPGIAHSRRVLGRGRSAFPDRPDRARRCTLSRPLRHLRRYRGMDRRPLAVGLQRIETSSAALPKRGPSAPLPPLRRQSRHRAAHPRKRGGRPYRRRSAGRLLAHAREEVPATIDGESPRPGRDGDRADAGVRRRAGDAQAHGRTSARGLRGIPWAALVRPVQGIAPDRRVFDGDARVVFSYFGMGAGRRGRGLS